MIIGKDKKISPSMDEWLRQAKTDPLALKEGMFLVHNGIVRQTSKARVHQEIDDAMVTGMDFTYDAIRVEAAIAQAYKMDGIFYVRVWLNEGKLELGDDIMYVLIGGDIRPNVVNALQFLVGKIKSECVSEIEKKER